MWTTHTVTKDDDNKNNNNKNNNNNIEYKIRYGPTFAPVYKSIYIKTFTRANQSVLFKPNDIEANQLLRIVYIICLLFLTGRQHHIHNTTFNIRPKRSVITHCIVGHQYKQLIEGFCLLTFTESTRGPTSFSFQVLPEMVFISNEISVSIFVIFFFSNFVIYETPSNCVKSC